MAVQYDPGVIVTFAERLYAEAESAIRIATLLGILIGGLMGIGVGAAISRDSPFVPALVGAAFLGVLGFLIGRARAFTLRLQAQTALCQVQIEANTRAAAGRLAA